MESDRRALVIIAALSGVFVVLLVLSQVLFRDTDSTPTNTSDTSDPAVVRQAAIEDFSAVDVAVPPDPRIFIFGSSLLDVPSKTLTAGLSGSSDLAIEYAIDDDGLTTMDAIAALPDRLRQPPFFLVADFGRDDAVAGIPPEETVENVRLLSTKIEEVGSRLLLVIGVSSDGSTSVSDRLRETYGQSVTVIDATPLMLTSAYRISATTLNSEGSRRLAEMIAAKISELNR